MKIRAEDGRQLRKVAVRLALSTSTRIDYFTGLPVDEFLEVLEEATEYGRQQKDRIRNRNSGWR